MLRRYAAVLILAGGCAVEAPAQTQRTIDRESEAAVASVLTAVDAVFTAHGRLPTFRPRASRRR